jgi:hypothetical protein
MITMLVTEANGIWQRFNFIVVIQVAFLTAALLALTNASSMLSVLSLPISYYGILLTYRSMTILDRLWAWHEAYIAEVRTIEGMLPGDPDDPQLPRSFERIKLDNTANKQMPAVVSISGDFLRVFHSEWNEKNPLWGSAHIEKYSNGELPARTECDSDLRQVYFIVCYILSPKSLNLSQTKWFSYRTTHQLLEIFFRIWVIIGVFALIRLSYALAYEIGRLI